MMSTEAGPCILFLGFVASGLFARATIAQSQPAEPCPYLQQARVSTAQSKWDDAARTLRSSIAKDSSCEKTSYLLGYVLLRANQPQASLKAYTAAARLRPPNSDEFTAIASDYILLKAWTDAEVWLRRAVQTVPVNSQAWYLLGRTEYNLDRNTAAVGSFKQSLQVSPEDPRAEYNLGLAYERLQQPDLARTAYEKAIRWGERLHSRDAQPYLDLAVLIRSQGNAEKALPLLQSASVLAPTNPFVFQELGRTYSEVKQPEQAIIALQRAIVLAPKAEPPHFFLGRLLRELGRKAEAEEQFTIVQQLLSDPSTAVTPNVDTVP